MSLTPSTYVNESLHVYSTFTTALASHEHGSKWPSDAVFYLEKFDRCGCWRVSVFPPESQADQTMKSYSVATSWGQLPCTYHPANKNTQVYGGMSRDGTALYDSLCGNGTSISVRSYFA